MGTVALVRLWRLRLRRVIGRTYGTGLRSTGLQHEGFVRQPYYAPDTMADSGDKLAGDCSSIRANANPPTDWRARIFYFHSCKRPKTPPLQKVAVKVHKNNPKTHEATLILQSYVFPQRL